MKLSRLVILFSLLTLTSSVFGFSLLAREAFLNIKEGNFEAAKNLLTDEKAQGDPDAIFLLGMMYDEGNGVEQDKLRAGSLYMEAGKLDNPIAQFYLGRFYRAGTGFDKNLDKAIFWFTKSSERGYSNAQQSLGFIYAGDERNDPDKAIYWLRESSRLGNTQAMGMLAALLSQSDENLPEAYAWSNLAAKYDPIQMATSTRFAVERLCSPEQIEEGKMLLVKFENEIRERFNKLKQGGTP